MLSWSDVLAFLREVGAKMGELRLVELADVTDLLLVLCCQAAAVLGAPGFFAWELVPETTQLALFMHTLVT